MISPSVERSHTQHKYLCALRDHGTDAPETLSAWLAGREAWGVARWTYPAPPSYVPPLWSPPATPEQTRIDLRTILNLDQAQLVVVHDALVGPGMKPQYTTTVITIDNLEQKAKPDEDEEFPR